MSSATIDLDVRDEPSANSHGSVLQLVTFRLGSEDYGVNIMNVQEIILIGQVTRLPNVPDHIHGLINLRGHVIPVVDLRTRFSLEPRKPGEQARIIIINVDRRTTGIVVDTVDQVCRVERSQVAPAPNGICGITQSYLSGLVKREEGLLMLLDVKQLIASGVETTS